MCQDGLSCLLVRLACILKAATVGLRMIADSALEWKVIHMPVCMGAYAHRRFYKKRSRYTGRPFQAGVA